MADKTTGELQQELMEQPNIKAYLSDNQSIFVEPGILDLLEALRIRCGLSKAEIARRSGMSEVYLHQVFSGRRNPSAVVAVRGAGRVPGGGAAGAPAGGIRPALPQAEAGCRYQPRADPPSHTQGDQRGPVRRE